VSCLLEVFQEPVQTRGVEFRGLARPQSPSIGQIAAVPVHFLTSHLPDSLSRGRNYFLVSLFFPTGESFASW